MPRTFKSLLLVLIMSLLAFGCAAPKDEPEASADFTSWARESLVPCEGDGFASARVDSALLAGAMGEARLVGLGESRHDTHEQFLVKGMLVRQLVEEQGFRALLIEESLPHARAIDRWVRGGDGELEDVMQEIAGWYLWDVEEMHELFRWMRAFNEGREAGDQVRVFGMDVTAPAQGVREVLAALESRGIARGLDEEKLGLELQEGDYWPTTWERYQGLIAERRDEALEAAKDA